jgi:hypothetical protein
MTRRLTEPEPSCAPPISLAWKELGEPDDYCDAIAVLLDCRGDDGHWMRRIGGDAVHRRVGALSKVAHELICVENHSTHDRARSPSGRPGPGSRSPWP